MAQWKAAGVQDPSLVQGTTIGMYFTPQPSGINCFSATVSSNLSALSLKPHFLETWIFWWPVNSNLALCRASIWCSLFCNAHGHDLSNVNPHHCALGLPEGTPHSCLQPRLGTARDRSDTQTSTGKLSPTSLPAANTRNRLHTLQRRLLFANTVQKHSSGLVECLGLTFFKHIFNFFRY